MNSSPRICISLMSLGTKSRIWFCISQGGTIPIKKQATWSQGTQNQQQVWRFLKSYELLNLVVAFCAGVSKRTNLLFLDERTELGRVEIVRPLPVFIIVVVGAVFVIMGRTLRTWLQLEEVQIEVHYELSGV